MEMFFFCQFQGYFYFSNFYKENYPIIIIMTVWQYDSIIIIMTVSDESLRMKQ